MKRNTIKGKPILPQCNLYEPIVRNIVLLGDGSAASSLLLAYMMKEFKVPDAHTNGTNSVLDLFSSGQLALPQLDPESTVYRTLSAATTAGTAPNKPNDFEMLIRLREELNAVVLQNQNILNDKQELAKRFVSEKTTLEAKNAKLRQELHQLTSLVHVIQNLLNRSELFKVCENPAPPPEFDSQNFNAYVDFNAKVRRKFSEGLNRFRIRAQDGIDFMIQNGFLTNNANSIAKFLFTVENLSKVEIGAYLGSSQARSQGILDAYVGIMTSTFLRECDFVTAVRVFFSFFVLPTETQASLQIYEAFAAGYLKYNPNAVSDANVPALQLLASSILALSAEMHGKDKQKTSRSHFQKLFKDTKLSTSYLSAVYDSIKNEEIKKPSSDDTITRRNSASSSTKNDDSEEQITFDTSAAVPYATIRCSKSIGNFVEEANTPTTPATGTFSSSPASSNTLMPSSAPPRTSVFELFSMKNRRTSAAAPATAIQTQLPASNSNSSTPVSTPTSAQQQQQQQQQLNVSGTARPFTITFRVIIERQLYVFNIIDSKSASAANSVVPGSYATSMASAVSEGMAAADEQILDGIIHLGNAFICAYSSQDHSSLKFCKKMIKRIADIKQSTGSGNAKLPIVLVGYLPNDSFIEVDAKYQRDLPNRNETRRVAFVHTNGKVVNVAADRACVPVRCLVPTPGSAAAAAQRALFLGSLTNGSNAKLAFFEACLPRCFDPLPSYLYPDPHTISLSLSLSIMDAISQPPSKINTPGPAVSPLVRTTVEMSDTTSDEVLLTITSKDPSDFQRRASEGAYHKKSKIIKRRASSPFWASVTSESEVSVIERVVELIKKPVDEESNDDVASTSAPIADVTLPVPPQPPRESSSRDLVGTPVIEPLKLDEVQVEMEDDRKQQKRRQGRQYPVPVGIEMLADEDIESADSVSDYEDDDDVDSVFGSVTLPFYTVFAHVAQYLSDASVVAPPITSLGFNTAGGSGSVQAAVLEAHRQHSSATSLRTQTLGRSVSPNRQTLT